MKSLTNLTTFVILSLLSLTIFSLAGCGSGGGDAAQVSAVTAGAQKTSIPGAEGKFVPDELLIQFVAGVTKEKENEVLRSHGASEIDEIQPIRVKRIKVPEQALEQVKEALSKNKHVKFVENNFLASAGGVPNDPSYQTQWHLAKVSAPAAWDISTGTSNIDIAIIDSGVDPTHPDLAGKLLPGWNFLNGTTDTHDVKGHGTAVAGTAAAVTNNAAGVAGMAWQNRIMPLVVLDAYNYARYSNIANAIIYAADRGVRVINVSIGGTSSSTTLQSAVTYAWNKGALVFACAMNDGVATPNYPAACANAMAVAATDSSDNKASFSNYGSWINISAPGTYIYTTNNGGGYGAWNGTSFSSPLTAGLAALVLSVNPLLSAQQVKDIMVQNSDDLGVAGFDQYFGFGRINAARTIDAAKGFIALSDTVAPVVAVSSPGAGATVGGDMSITVTATDNTGVTKGELFINGTMLASDTVAPFTFLWDTTKYSDGIYQLMVKAYDPAGNVASSSVVSVTVKNNTDSIAPVVRIAEPADGAIITALKKLNVTVVATDNVGVIRSELYIDGVMKAAGVSSVTWSLNVRAVTTGAHTVVGKAYDAAGNESMISSTIFK